MVRFMGNGKEIIATVLIPLSNRRLGEKGKPWSTVVLENETGRSEPDCHRIGPQGVRPDQFACTMPGGFQVPSPGGKMDGACVFGQ
jgi:hypothetical protein